MATCPQVQRDRLQTYVLSGVTGLEVDVPDAALSVFAGRPLVNRGNHQHCGCVPHRRLAQCHLVQLGPPIPLRSLLTGRLGQLGPCQQRPWGPGDGAPLAELDTTRASRWLERDPPRPGHRPETFTKLAHFLGSEAGIPPGLQEPMILDLMALRARFCPQVGTLATGQMPLAAMHVKTGRSLGQPSRHQRLAPVVVSLLADGDGHTLRYRPPTSYEGFLALCGRRMAPGY